MTQRIVPFIGYEDAAAAIDWLERAFGFAEDRSARHEEDGTITHAELDLGGRRSTSRRRTATRARADCARSPSSHVARTTTRGSSTGTSSRWTTSTLTTSGHVRAGATILREPEEPGIGHRIYSAEDLEGHRWMFGQRL